MSTGGRRRLVIVGNGMAGARLAREVLARAGERWSVTVAGAEPHGAYNRVLLSSLLAGEVERAGIDLDWSQAADLRLGEPVVAIDRAARQVRLGGGATLGYDRLALATGSEAIKLPLPGADLPEVMTFRDLADCERLAATARAGGRAVVIGGGLLGLEAAVGLAGRGMAVMLVHLADRLMERQLDRDASMLVERAVSRRGVTCLLEAQTRELVRHGAGVLVRLADGRELPADLVVMAVGVRPENRLARAAGLACQRGVQVDDALTTSDPAIVAVGECIEHRGLTYGLVAPIWEQVDVLGRRFAGDDGALYAGSVVGSALKISGVDVYAAGQAAAPDPDEQAIVLRDPEIGLYRRLNLKDGRLTGVMMVGETGDAPWLFDLMQRRVDLGAQRGRVIFGRAFCDDQAAMEHA
jgi:nitrite reductase (NADH) large subunit